MELKEVSIEEQDKLRKEGTKDIDVDVNCENCLNDLKKLIALSEFNRYGTVTLKVIPNINSYGISTHSHIEIDRNCFNDTIKMMQESIKDELKGKTDEFKRLEQLKIK